MSAPASVVMPEFPLLLLACSAAVSREGQAWELPETNDISWHGLIKLADQHGVIPLLHRALGSVHGSISEDQMERISRLHQTNLHRSLFLARELIRILDALNEAGIEVLPYKGVTVAETIYGDMALRQPGDIDLLIRPSDFSRARQVLGQLGYKPHETLSAAAERAYLRSGYECAFDGPAGSNLLELQWALQPRFYSVDLNVEDLFARAVPVTVAGRNLRTLSPEDLLIVLSLHAAKHVWARLIWLCDIGRIMALPNLNWKQISEVAHTLGIVRILSVTFLLTERLLGVRLPAMTAGMFVGDSQAPLLGDEVQSRLLSGAVCDVESTAYFRMMLRLRERRSDQARFLSRLAFTPGPGEWKAVDLPAPLFPLYRVVRLSRLAARAARLG